MAAGQILVPDGSALASPQRLAGDTWAQGADTVTGQAYVLYGPDGVPIATSTGTPGAADKGLVVRRVGTADVEGPDAIDAPMVGSPVLMGGRASQNEPTAVGADNDVQALWITRKGALVVQLGFPPNVAAANSQGPQVFTQTAVGPTALLTAPAAGNSIHVTAILATNSSATQTTINFRDGATDRVGGVLAPAGGGFAVSPFTPPWKLTAATALNVTLSTAVTDVRIVIHYYVAP